MISQDKMRQENISSRGDSHVKMTGMLVGSFRKTLLKVPESCLMAQNGFLPLRGEYAHFTSQVRARVKFEPESSSSHESSSSQVQVKFKNISFCPFIISMPFIIFLVV